MNKSVYKIKAQQFLEHYNDTSINLEKLKSIIESQGYKIVYLNVLENHDAVEQLLAIIHCEEYAKVCKAFTYKDGFNQVVFIDGNLQENDMLHALAHEEGHIYCGHMEKSTCSVACVEDEWEANEFAHYILNPGTAFKLKRFFKTHKKAIIAILSLIIIISAIIITKDCLMAKKGYTKTLDYYVTETGTKYHTSDCIYIKDAKYSRKITLDEFKQGIYEPCDKCLE